MRVIAVLTDFGTKDHYVGVMKGVILSINPSAKIVDLCHEVTPFSIKEAAFLLEASYRYFPEGSVFLVVIDPGVGSSRRPIVVQSKRRFFVGPDNGVFTPIVDEKSRFFSFPIPQGASCTFHGRDVFAPVCARLTLGETPEKFSEEIFDPVLIDYPPVEKTSGGFRGEVLHVDRFGNIVTSIRGELVKSRSFMLEIGGKEIFCPLRRFYYEAGEGEVFPIVGSSGYLEVSVREGNAAEVLGVGVGDKVILKWI